MDKALVTSINRRLLDNVGGGVTDTAAGPGCVPGSAFTDADLLALEWQRLFRDTPQLVAFSGELSGPGHYLSLNVAGTPVLLSRDNEGSLHALVNACAHRGAAVAGGSGECRAFVCPFHGWAYHRDGRLRGRPEQQYFDDSDSLLDLVRLPVSEKYGLIVVGAHAGVDQTAVDAALDEAGDELSGIDFPAYTPIERRHYEVSANWKLVNDLSLESYHFAQLHRDSVAEILEANAVVDTYQRYSRWAFPSKTITRLASLPEEEWPEDIEGSVTYTFYPGVMVLVNSLGAQMIRAEPLGEPGRTTVTYTSMLRPGCDAAAGSEASAFGAAVFADEDLPIAEACQSGIEARGGDFPLGANEPLLQYWHRLWAEAVS